MFRGGPHTKVLRRNRGDSLSRQPPPAANAAGPQPFAWTLARRATRAYTEDVTSWTGVHVVNLTYNCEFEHGHAIERFQFKVEDDGPRLLVYGYILGKKMECFGSRCEQVDLGEKSASLTQ